MPYEGPPDVMAWLSSVTRAEGFARIEAWVHAARPALRQLHAAPATAPAVTPFPAGPARTLGPPPPALPAGADVARGLDQDAQDLALPTGADLLSRVAQPTGADVVMGARPGRAGRRVSER